MEISNYLAKIKGSATALMFAQARELERQGRDIIHLEIGQPDFLPVEQILKATSQAVLSGKTQYTVSRGIDEFREEIAIYHKKLNNIDLNYNTEVIITSGGKLGLFGALWALLNIGDNVILLNPSWVSYKDIISSLGAEPRFLPVDSNFEFDEEELVKLIDKNTKAVLVNSPSNPTGAMISEKNLKNLYNICNANGILLVSDEMYSEFTYDKNKHHSVLDIKDWQESGIIINGLSKTFSMTGFRLGYVLAEKRIIDEVNKVNQLTASCPTNFAQYGGIEAYKQIDLMRLRINEIMPRRRNLVSNLLLDLDVEFKPPQGAFYAWIGIPGLNDSAKWAENLLLREGVAVTPGAAFGPAGEGFVRLSFATSDNIVIEGIKRIQNFLD